MSRSPLAALLLGVTAAAATAQTAEEMPVVTIEGRAVQGNAMVLDGDELAARRSTAFDTASLLDGLPGLGVASYGGLSGLPSIHGLADDRIRTSVDGIPMAAACPMHMNPPLSDIAPSAVARIDILPGVTPVSLGGDSIGGTIAVQSAPPKFASGADPFLAEGQITTFYHSNGAGVGVAASAEIATRDLSLAYQGSGSRSEDWRAGGGERISASRFETSDQRLTGAWRSGQNLFVLEAAVQDRPYEGFPNATMDLTGNLAEFVNGRYQRDFDGGRLTATVYWDHIRHEMNGDGKDRYPTVMMSDDGSIASMGDMPSRQTAQDYGYRLQAEFNLPDTATLRLGSELQAQKFDDVWAGAPAGMMSDFIDIDNASRVRLGDYVEWQKQWRDGWAAELGLRDDLVWMDTGTVQGYDGVDDMAAAFNASKRARFDDNVDATALAAFTPDERQSYSLGLARKNRSPNFYERYAWNSSTIGMVGWFGDGNGYTGSPTLRPETAYSASFSADWHGEAWEIKATPYYSDIQNYIGVETLCGPACSGMPASQLTFANHHARLYGADVSGAVRLIEGGSLGTIRLSANGGISHGQDLTAHTGLYHMMPLQGALTLHQIIGNWSNSLQLTAADAKNEVDTQRNEPTTPGYGVLSASSAYRLEHWRFAVTVRNLLDHRYDDPLGGAWLSAFYPMGTMASSYRPLPAQGRSVDAAMTLLF